MWQGIIGHDAVVERFRTALRCGRLASTYLFVGPEGIGKRSFAERLAAAMLCSAANDVDLEACGACQSCRQFAAGAHPDYDAVALPPGRRSLPIELFIGDRDHRNQEGLCHNLSLRPQLGSRRAALIDDADWLTTESANCLLKTLEEPPPGVLLILIGTSRSRQLPTILSRSQVVRFAPPDPESAAELILTQGIVTDRDEAVRLAREADGSLSRAAALADPELRELGERLRRQFDSGRIDAARTARDVNEVIQAAGKEAEPRRQRFRQVLALSAAAYRVALRSYAEQGLDSDHSRVGAVIESLDRCLAAEEQLNRNANQATLLESWLNDLARLGASSPDAAPAGAR
ncbi:AAA family ATPase [Pirellulales bacterium]|nr:AAA family ATPase [Pirellulales bacterium]